VTHEELEMSLGACIPGMVKRGEIDPARGARMAELFAELESFYRRSMGPDAAAAQASEATLKQLAAEARLKKRQTLLQINRQREALKDLEKHRDGASYVAIRAMLDDDAAGAPYGNVTRSAQIIEFDAHRQLAGFIERHRRDLIGRPKDRDGLWDVVREMHGEATGNARAKTFADAIRDVTEQLRQRFNAAGGAIGKLEHWYPHRWDSTRVREASADEWVDALMPELDRARMIDDRTSAPFTDARLREVLLDVRETIRTGGLTGEASAAFRGPGKLAKQRAEHRFLHFVDADAWRRVNDRFGAEGNAFTAIMGHIGGMAHDIAQLERFGPNPDATVRLLLDTVARKNAAPDDGAYSADAAGRSGGRVMTEQLWRYVKGEGRTPIVPDSWLQGPPVSVSAGFDAVRNTLTAAMLGSSPLSAISDVGTQIMARKFNGLPATSVLWGYLKQLNPASGADRRLAIRLGLGMRDASRAMLTIGRYMNTVEGPAWSAIAPDAVLRLAGLNKFTEAGQRAFGVQFLGELAEYRTAAWAELPPQLRGSMERYGLDQHSWQDIRTATVEVDGAHFVDAGAVRERRTAERLMTMVLAETNRAVQDSSALVKSRLQGDTRPGEWRYIGSANTTQFLGFGIGLIVDQGRRIAAMPGANAARYAASFFVTMTLLGTLSIQLREIAKGRDPRPMDTAEFWFDAALQSGGLGILGDLIGQFENGRLSHNILLVGGPVGSLAGDTRDAIVRAFPGPERKDGTRREGDPGGAAVGLLRRYTPGTNIWYLRAALERLVWDELDEMGSSSHDDRLERRAKQLEKNRQGEWWASGSMSPTRAPDFANALGGESPP
jgi:hypothetical protein